MSNVLPQHIKKGVKPDYTYWVEPVPLNPNFPNFLSRNLIRSIDELKKIFEANKDKKYMGWDTETTGLDPSSDCIVGYSFSYDGVTGYYVPVNHAVGNSLGREALELFYEELCRVKVSFLANAKFDLGMMEIAEKFDMSKVSYYDIFVGIFLADTNIPFPNLKDTALQWLGWDMVHFDEVLGDNYNFYYLDPEDAYDYACVDAISTYKLAPLTMQFYKEAKTSGKIDNKFIYPLVQCEKHIMNIDVELLQSIANDQRKRLEELSQLIYKEAGKQFNINSGKQLSDVLLSLGLDTGERGKSGYMSTGGKLLEKLYSKTNHPILQYLCEQKVLQKSLSTYSQKIADEATKKGGKLRFCYHMFNAPTCRLAGGKDKKNDYYCQVNIHAIPKPHSKMWYVHPYKPGDHVNEGDRVVLDWRFSLVEESDTLAEALDPHHNIRDAFMPDDGHYWVSIDYSTQELKAIANYSKTKVWVDTFVHGGDLHKNMAIAIWGEENYTSDLRKKAKGANFGFVYGMSKYTCSENFKISLDEAEELISKWWSAVPEIRRFQTYSIKQARKTGVNYNYLGRPRRVKYYFNHPERKTQAFGERTVKNNPIQSLGADICKLAHIKIWERILSKPENKGLVSYLSTVHDEVNLSITKDPKHFYRLLKDFYDCMYLTLPGFDVPFDVGIEIGTRWGDSFVFEYDKDFNLYPVTEKAKPKKKETPKKVEETIEKSIADDFSFDLDI